MRCEDVLQRLPELAYDELPAEAAAQCRRHLEECAACRAEWDGVRGALVLLDQAPFHETQVDLATICLRLAREQRRVRSVSLWVSGLAAAAAAVIGFAGAKLLAVDLEPGRLIVAWNATGSGGATGPGGAADRVESSPTSGDSGAGQVAHAPTAVPAGGSPSHHHLARSTEERGAEEILEVGAALASLFDDRPPGWQKTRDTWLDGDTPWEDHREATRAAAHGAPASPPESTGFSDLRKKWLKEQAEISPSAVRGRGSAPGA